MEADLARFYGIDYRDRWRGGDLTLRRLMALLRHLPDESAVATIERDGAPPWTVEAHLLDDLRIVWTTSKEHPAKPHPGRPRPDRQRRQDPDRVRKLAAARRRAAERRHAIDAVELD